MSFCLAQTKKPECPMKMASLLTKWKTYGISHAVSSASTRLPWGSLRQAWDSTVRCPPTYPRQTSRVAHSQGSARWIWRDPAREVCKLDVNYQIGDTLLLREYVQETEVFSGEEVMEAVTHITLPGTFGLPDDVGVMSIEKRHNELEPITIESARIWRARSYARGKPLIIDVYRYWQ